MLREAPVSTALVTDLTIFVLALLVGIEVIGKVPATLHTPLMSATNSIHGIVLAGALLIGVTAHTVVGYILAFIAAVFASANVVRSEEHTSELQSRPHLVCRLLLEKKNNSPPRLATPQSNEQDPTTLSPSMS